MTTKHERLLSYWQQYKEKALNASNISFEDYLQELEDTTIRLTIIEKNIIPTMVINTPGFLQWKERRKEWIKNHGGVILIPYKEWCIEEQPENNLELIKQNMSNDEKQVYERITKGDITVRKCFGSMDCLVTGNCDNCNDYKECWTKSFEIEHCIEEGLNKK